MSVRVSRNNLKAGAFLLIALVGFMAIALKLGNVYDSLTQSRNNYVVKFAIADGAMGLKKGSIVKIGGQQVGEVRKVDFKPPDGATAVPPHEAPAIPAKPAVADPDPNDKSEPPDGIYVTISVDAERQLFHDAKVYLELPLLGNVSAINIPDIGGDSYGVPARQAGILKDMEIIPGTLAPPAFLGQAGYGADQKEQLQIILQRGKEIATQVNEIVGSTRGALDDTLGSLKQAAANVNQATAQVNRRVPDWAELVTRTLTSLAGATDQAEQRLIEARVALAAVKDLIADNRAYIDRIFSGAAATSDNLSQITHKINNELYQVVKDTLTDGRRTMSRFADVGDKAGQLMTEKGPELSRIIANARLASDQLKLAMTEVRRNPWRLLYQPTRREIEEELTYDSARTYADAVGQLRAASEAMEAISSSAGNNGLTPEQQQRLRELTQEVEGAFERYREAERRFLDRLTRDGGR